MPGRNHFQNQEELIKEVEIELQKGLGRTGGELPQVLVIGALGRCGKGAFFAEQSRYQSSNCSNGTCQRRRKAALSRRFGSLM